MAFRGSRSLSTWIANFDFGTEDVNSICPGCKAHGGFWKSWEGVADSLGAQIKSAVDAHPEYTLVFTGHSFGGAMATLGATAMRNDGYKIELVRPFFSLIEEVMLTHPVYLWLSSLGK